MYFHKTPELLKPIYNDLVWDVPTTEREIFITFDDGPVPDATTIALDILKDYEVKATFFCIGDNVIKHPDIFERVIAEGHGIGNHSLNHLNGWKYNDYSYVKNVLECARLVDSKLYRPPYGKIKRSQATALRKRFTVVMWDVISGDFDHKVSMDKCVRNVTDNAVPGSIIVFHDSRKAMEKMAYALPRVIEYFRDEGYSFGIIPQDIKPPSVR